MDPPDNNFELISFANADELASRVAGGWLDEIEIAHRSGRTYCVALSGGRIAKTFFAAAAESAKIRKTGGGDTPFFPRNAHFFWADERCVPPDDPESNFKLANEQLFVPLQIPRNQIHRIRGELSLEDAVKMANEEILRVTADFGAERSRPGHGSWRPAPNANASGEARALPVLDLILLGMGEDGHIASLFPGAPPEILNCAGPFLAVEKAPKPPPKRISLSYAAIAAARQLWVLISGAGKEAALRESVSPNGETPLARVVRSRSQTVIFSDIRPD